MIYLLLDIVLSYFSKIPTFFFLLNLVLIKKKDFNKLIIITLVLDLLILNTYFLNTILLTTIFFFYKKIKITKMTLTNYIVSLIFIYITYNLSIGLINGYNIFTIIKFIITNIIYSLIFYLLSYKILKKNIKLSRW